MINYETMLGDYGCGSLIVWNPTTDIHNAVSLSTLANRAQVAARELRGLPVWLHQRTWLAAGVVGAGQPSRESGGRLSPALPTHRIHR